MKNKEIICPFCHSTDVSKILNNEMNYSSSFRLDNTEKNHFYNCLNCGCAFEKGERIKDWNKPTEISKKEFFDIIFAAICDIFEIEEKDKPAKRKKIEDLYDGMVKTYYKEIAIMQSEAFYEADSEFLKYEFIKSISEIK